ncbi:MAG: hypothetical protein WC901_04695 [Candidatus Margulisiibacteriota bacterium]
MIDWERIFIIIGVVSAAFVLVVLILVLPITRDYFLDNACNSGLGFGCKERPYGCDKLTLIAIDISNLANQSGNQIGNQNNNQKPNDIKKNYKGFINKLIYDSEDKLNGLIIQPGSCVYAEQFAGDVLTKQYPNRFENVPFKDPSKIKSPAIEEAQKNIEKDFDELLNNIHVEKPGAEVWNESIKMASKIDALKNERYFDSNGNEKRRFNPDGEINFYIFSPMLECSLGVIDCFDHPDIDCVQVEKMIDIEDSKGNLPDLKNVHVIVRGVGEGAEDPDGKLYKNIKCSWESFFKKSGADICSSCFTND